MAGLIKNQILKHLSKFAKNLTPDKINLSTLKGEGELAGLELDEKLLTELLDLPAWICLRKAVCNRVAVKIQWTKLKSQPICLYLDEIVVDMETCEELQKSDAASPLAGYSSGGKYGFAERIIDGMFVSINSVVVNFRAKAFGASIQISRIIIQSKTPTWKNEDLRLTRIKDDLRGEILIFKEAEWQTLRIEANAMEGCSPMLATTPLRLIANQSKIRITIKKKLADCGMIASRLQVNLDDLLWVLTDSQMKAAIVFANSLRDVIQKSNKQSKHLAAEKLQKQNQFQSMHHSTQGQQHAQRNLSRSQQAVAKMFARYDVQETSYHVYTGRVDLHLCDDAAPGKEDYKRRVDGGAMQVTLHKIGFDYYPFHPAGADRSHWLKYDENMSARDAWTSSLLDHFKDSVHKVKGVLQTQKKQQDVRTTNQEAHMGGNPVPQDQSRRTQSQGGTAINNTGTRNTPIHVQAQRQTKLLESSMVVRLEDFAIYRVSTAHDHKRSSPKKFIASDKKQLLLPPEMSSIHVEYTDYYFPEGMEHPSPPKIRRLKKNFQLTPEAKTPDNKFLDFVPHANMYVVINPVRLTLDYLTVVWLNAFALNLLKRADIPIDDDIKYHVDIKMDALMPRVILPSECEVSGQSDRPDGLQLQVSRLTITNTRDEPKASCQELSSTLEKLDSCKLFFSQDFPSPSGGFTMLPTIFKKHACKADNVYCNQAVQQILCNTSERTFSCSDLDKLQTNSLRMDNKKDIWCIAMDQIWVEFIGVPSSKNRPVSFVESFPITIWIAKPLLSKKDNNDSKRVDTDHVAEQSGSVCRHDMADADKCTFLLGRLDEPFYNGHNGQSCGIQQCHKPTEKLADLHFVLQIGAKVNIQVNHYQFLFLMRLIDTITKYQAEINEDVKMITNEPPAPMALSVAVCVEEVEVALICPPLRELPSLNAHRQDLLEDELSEDFSSKAEDTPHQMPSLTADSDFDCAALLANTRFSELPNHENGTDTEIESTNFSRDPSPDCTSIPSTLAEPPSEYDYPISVNASPLRQPPMSNGMMNDASHAPLRRLAGGSPKMTNHTGHQTVTDAGGESYVAPVVPTVSYTAPTPKKPTTTQQDIKKSFNTAFNNIGKFTKTVTKAAKEKLEIDDGGFEDCETISVKSGSSDDEEFMILKFQNETETPAFISRHLGADDSSTADLTSENQDDSESTTTSFTTHDGIERPKGMVSIVCMRLLGIEAAVQIDGDDIYTSVQAHHVIPVEHGNVNLDQFQANFASELPHRHNLFTLLQSLTAMKDRKEQLPTVTDPPVKLQFNMGPAASSFSAAAVEKGYLSLRAQGINLRLLTSSLTNITDLIEDEQLGEPLPMLVEVTDSLITLKDDKTPTHMTSPGTVPLNLRLSSAVIRRTDDGTFHVTAQAREMTRPWLSSELSSPVSSSGAPTSSLNGRTDSQSQLHELMEENAELRSQIRQVRLEQGCLRQLEQPDGPMASMQKENQQLKEQLQKIRSSQSLEAVSKKDYAGLKAENGQMSAIIVEQKTEVATLRQERESLLAAIQMLQSELTASEDMRTRNFVA